jgi:hypothetical protein
MLPRPQQQSLLPDVGGLYFHSEHPEPGAPKAIAPARKPLAISNCIDVEISGYELFAEIPLLPFVRQTPDPLRSAVSMS